MVKGGRYVQGGGCLTVGVAGLVLGGGFGSLSKAFGIGRRAISSRPRSSPRTAQSEIANACTNPDLFWALKGAAAGSASSPA